MASYDVVVCGLGVMGSAALYHLARRGRRVLGLDRFAAGHDRGSSHGETRIIRLAYFEHPSYVPLVRRAYQLWRELETEAARTLLHVTGIAEIGPPDGALVNGTLDAARLHEIPHDLIAAPELTRRYPGFQLPPHYVGVVQPDGGFLEAEASVQAHQALARKHGAEIRYGEPIRAIEPKNDNARVVTDHATIEAGSVIVAAGPWTSSLLPNARLPLRVTRQVLAWFAPEVPSDFSPERFPVFLIESAHGIHYGFPSFGTGFKVAKHHHADEAVDPETYERQVTSEDEAMIRAAIADHLPGANGPLIDARTCLYTVAPDGDFIVDRLPGAASIVVASPCSGHGFKFAPVIGEALADLADGLPSRHDISRFRIGRFA
ncbi:MAG: N-methyl-L-tryptophan oxidase [Xanthobacteraceae bacterium]|nr:N-methyl-L-tryptophan oxidase [Xanthobacteraceae bacterium]